MGRLNLLFFKQENGSFERTKRKGQRNGFLQPVSGSFSFGEESKFIALHIAFHGDDPSSSFEKRRTEDEKGSKI